MTGEHEREPIHLTAIHVDLHERTITFEADDRSATRLTYSPRAVLYELLGTDRAATSAPEAALRQRRQPTEAAAAHQDPQAASPSKEKAPTTVLPGKLQTKPKDGRPDRHQKPTAWAQLLAHIEGREGATLLSTSFHGRTRELALSLHRRPSHRAGLPALTPGR